MQLVTHALWKHALDRTQFGKGKNCKGVGSDEFVECFVVSEEGQDKLAENRGRIGRF